MRLLILGCVLVLAGCEAATAIEPTATPRPTRMPDYAVVYRVTTDTVTQHVALTYRNAQENSEQQTGRITGGDWESRFTAEPGQFLYVSVQNRDDSGTVTCEILVDGRVIESATSRGGHVIATCSGSVPR